MSATTRRSLQIKEGRDPYQAAYMAGYADGEGCFCVTFNRSSRHRFGWEIRPSFRSVRIPTAPKCWTCSCRPSVTERSDRTGRIER